MTKVTKAAPDLGGNRKEIDWRQWAPKKKNENENEKDSLALILIVQLVLSPKTRGKGKSVLRIFKPPNLRKTSGPDGNEEPFMINEFISDENFEILKFFFLFNLTFNQILKFCE